MKLGMRKLAGVVVLLVALIAAGCGGGDDTAAPTLTKAAFIKQGDAICAKANKEQESGLILYAKENPGTLSSDKGQEKLILAVGLPPLQRQTEALAELNPPEEDQEEIDEMIASFETALEKSRKDPSELLTGVGAFADATNMARTYGFKVCSSVS